MHIHRKILAIIVLSAIILTNISCAPVGEGGFLRVLDSAAEMNISGERHGVPFAATLTLSARDEAGQRDGSMIFTSPEALKGIRVSTAGGVFGAELDGVSFSGTPAELLAAPLVLMTLTGDVSQAEKITAESGEAQTRIVMNTGEGSVEFIIDSKSGLPAAVREKDENGDIIMEFEITGFFLKGD